MPTSIWAACFRLVPSALPSSRFSSRQCDWARPVLRRSWRSGDLVKSERVYNEILDRLLSGRWEPGYVFNRRQIAAEMKVSVAPVLEAMLELEGEGLIETLPRKGTRVRALTIRDLQGQLIVREALECQAARMYC